MLGFIGLRVSVLTAMAVPDTSTRNHVKIRTIGGVGTLDMTFSVDWRGSSGQQLHCDFPDGDIFNGGSTCGNTPNTFSLACSAHNISFRVYLECTWNKMFYGFVGYLYLHGFPDDTIQLNTVTHEWWVAGERWTAEITSTGTGNTITHELGKDISYSPTIWIIVEPPRTATTPPKSTPRATSSRSRSNSATVTPSRLFLPSLKSFSEFLKQRTGGVRFSARTWHTNVGRRSDGIRRSDLRHTERFMNTQLNFSRPHGSLGMPFTIPVESDGPFGLTEEAWGRSSIFQTMGSARASGGFETKRFLTARIDAATKVYRESWQLGSAVGAPSLELVPSSRFALSYAESRGRLQAGPIVGIVIGAAALLGLLAALGAICWLLHRAKSEEEEVIRSRSWLVEQCQPDVSECVTGLSPFETFSQHSEDSGPDLSNGLGVVLE